MMSKLLVGLVVATGLCITLSAKPSRPTGVGNGGDVIERFLIGTRLVLVDSITRVSQLGGVDFSCQCNSDKSTDLLCVYLRSLAPSERLMCRQFVLETAPQILALARSGSEVNFALSSKPLLVPDPQGVMRPVRAITPLGPRGDITFHYDSLNAMLPTSLLALMMHEFSHKVEFAGVGKFVEDNLPIGVFTSAGGGRRLLDAVGAGVAVYAAEKGWIGQAGDIQDLFTCEIKDSVTGTDTESKGASLRLFRDTDQKVFDTGIGGLPRDFSCYFWENGKKSWLDFLVQIHESDGCLTSNSEKRLTKLELWRHFRDPAKPSLLLAEKAFPNANAVCSQLNEPVMELEVKEGERRLTFTAKYLGARSYRTEKARQVLYR